MKDDPIVAMFIIYDSAVIRQHRANLRNMR